MYATRHTSPRARSGAEPNARPRHCAYCGRGLTARTRARLSPASRLLLAIFGRPTSALCNRRACIARAVAPVHALRVEARTAGTTAGLHF